MKYLILILFLTSCISSEDKWIEKGKLLKDNEGCAFWTTSNLLAGNILTFTKELSDPTCTFKED